LFELKKGLENLTLKELSLFIILMVSENEKTKTKMQINSLLLHNTNFKMQDR